MGYLFYADALGIQAQLQKNPKLAEAALQSIHTIATEALHSTLPHTNKRLAADQTNSLTIFNDSIFFYCSDLPSLIHYTSQVTYRLFMLPPKKGGPVALRGTIVETQEHPTIITSEVDTKTTLTQVKSSRLTTPNIGTALIADKKKVLGARIIIPRKLLTNIETWDYRIQAKVMLLAGLSEKIDSDTLKTDKELRDYCDIAWMNTPTNDNFSDLKNTIHEFTYNAALNQRAALHAAATLAIYQATKTRRHGIVVILRKLWTGVSKKKNLDRQPAAKDDYSGWFSLAGDIKKHNNNVLYFPIDMTGGDLARAIRPPDKQRLISPRKE